jgi:hypothetical protein
VVTAAGVDLADAVQGGDAADLAESAAHREYDEAVERAANRPPDPEG